MYAVYLSELIFLSTRITGMPQSYAFSITGVMASASFGATTIASISSSMNLSISAICLPLSSPADTISNSTSGWNSISRLNSRFNCRRHSSSLHWENPIRRTGLSFWQEQKENTADRLIINGIDLDFIICGYFPVAANQFFSSPQIYEYLKNSAIMTTFVSVLRNSKQL